MTVTEATGGRIPFDRRNAAVGPARVLWAETDVAIPADIPIPFVADEDGEYPPLTGWNDFGLAADAPTYTHDKDTEGLSYQNTPGTLFEQVSEVTRSFTAQVGEISADTLKIMENSSTVEAVAAGANKSAIKKVHTGLYSDLKQYRLAFIMYRPSGSDLVTEPPPSPVGTRPPLIARILPIVALAAEGTDVEMDREDPVNMEIEFTVFPDTTLAAGREHGYWVTEDGGIIAAA
jgi:hypothetical protein